MHPHNDFEDMGNCVAVTVDARVAGAASSGRALSHALALEMWARRDTFAVTALPVRQTRLASVSISGGVATHASSLPPPDGP